MEEIQISASLLYYQRYLMIVLKHAVSGILPDVMFRVDSPELPQFMTLVFVLRF